MLVEQINQRHRLQKAPRRQAHHPHVKMQFLIKRTRSSGHAAIKVISGKLSVSSGPVDEQWKKGEEETFPEE